MGTTRWSDDHYRDRARLRARTGRDAFEYDHAIRNGAADRAVHPKMNPRGVRVRESRDSAAHPESHAVAVLFDVTGSMQGVPRILQAHLPKLMGLLIRKGYLDHPQILIGAIGDATCDDAPRRRLGADGGLRQVAANPLRAPEVSPTFPDLRRQRWAPPVGPTTTTTTGHDSAG